LGTKTKRPQIFVCYDLLERLTDEKKSDFKNKPKLFSIGIIIILDETVSLLNIGVLEVIINGKSDLEQRT
jgi:hypothetical protein